ncbi:LOW QUALITY PROTEIN: EEF1A lysine methyltransferase 3 [Accipiter gentilis]|uniref:LOW QUALITY PROTEIN: EEF1A lysine methyltransferase 3 n=1 Tax=Astur gentilis TaxID=8957 RepID=UPI00211056FC|nr:LOW QUALITY PROTEIN: EEF1A lysine methyltransferase 3 [Accipiter gentilis]
MAAPGCHVGVGVRWEVVAGTGTGEGTEEEEEAALRSVFPRDPELFADAFPVERRYRLCGRVLRIAQHHGPRLGPAASVWEAALSLCRYLEEQRFDFRGRTVIELGAGTGIVGILAALLGGDVTITDQPAALDQIRENVRLNFPVEGGRPQVRALLWGQDEGSFRPEYEVILGSDIVYHPPSFSPLLGTLRHLCGPRSFALLCAKMRGGDAGARRFFRQMLPPYFRIQLLRREAEEEIEIYRVTRRGDDPIEEGGDTHTTPAGCCSGGGCA